MFCNYILFEPIAYNCYSLRLPAPEGEGPGVGTVLSPISFYLLLSPFISSYLPLSPPIFLSLPLSTKYKTIMMWLIPGYRVLRQSAAAPGVYTAHTVNVKVDVQVDEAPARKVLRVTRSGKVLFAVVPRTNTQRLTAVDAQFLCGRRNLKPANVAAVAVILRFQILCLVC